MEQYEHVDYPHNPGQLYDCPACEAECLCNPIKIMLGEETQCVFCASLESERDGGCRE